MPSQIFENTEYILVSQTLLVEKQTILITQRQNDFNLLGNIKPKLAKLFKETSHYLTYIALVQIVNL